MKIKGEIRFWRFRLMCNWQILGFAVGYAQHYLRYPKDGWENYWKLCFHVIFFDIQIKLWEGAEIE